jgi:hypothetical protein
LRALVLVAVVAAAAVVAYLPFTWTPDVVPGSALPTEFSAVRAMVDLRAVASQPRSIGTAAHEATIDTIQSRLDAMGVASQVVQDVVAWPDFGQVFAGRLRNVIARVPGRDSTGAVLLVSHYDSVPTSRNANDGGLGVATALETVRATSRSAAGQRRDRVVRRRRRDHGDEHADPATPPVVRRRGDRVGVRSDRRAGPELAQLCR